MASVAPTTALVPRAMLSEKAAFAPVPKAIEPEADANAPVPIAELFVPVALAHSLAVSIDPLLSRSSQEPMARPLFLEV